MADESLLAQFKQLYHRARTAREELSSTQLQLNLRADVKAQSMRVGLDAAPAHELCRLGANVEPLADPDSPYYVKTVAQKLSSLPEGQSVQEVLVRLQQVVERPFPRGVPVTLNGTPYDGPGMSRLLARGGFFHEEEDARRELQGLLSCSVAAKLVWFNFFSHCSAVVDYARVVYEVIRALEKEKPGWLSRPKPLQEGPCIYCLQSDGGFKSVEHVYPESLGNTEVFLGSGIVCDRCNNNALARLDACLVESDPIAMLRTVFVPLNPKTGRFFRAKGDGLTLEKTAPRHLRLVTHDGDRGVKVTKAGDKVRINVTMKGRRKFDPIALGRSLYKVGLGFVAFKQGPDAARASRYDAARRFIMGETEFRNRIALSKKGVPHHQIRTVYHSLERGSLFIVDLFGMRYLFNLEEKPMLRREADPIGFEVFDLWTGSRQ